MEPGQPQWLQTSAWGVYMTNFAEPIGAPPLKLPTASSDMFTPKLISVLREGYTSANLRADAIAGITVAVVALPLSMAIAIGSGAKPENGLYTAIVGGFLISALGGSRFQIGGPAAAFLTLVAATIEAFGMGGLMLATIMAGVMMLIIGYCRLGAYIKYIPHPVTIGFTAGIAALIFAGQMHDLFGLQIEHEPSAFLPKLRSLWAAAATLSPAALAIGLGSVAVILALRKLAPRAPGMLVAIVLAGIAVWAMGLPVDTIASRYGGVPATPPMPAWPQFPLSRIGELVPSAIAIAILGGIESLLSAVVADGMTGRRHRSNCELVAQGYANIACGIFGGICATGTIARTATNVRAGAHGPIAGIFHAGFLLAFMFLAAPLLGKIPLAALAAVLLTVAWNMVESSQIAAILRHHRGEAVVLAGTFLLTVFEGLTEGIFFGVALGSLLFMHRMAQLVERATGKAVLEGDPGEAAEAANVLRRGVDGQSGEIMVFSIVGPFFFGAASAVSEVLDRLGQKPRHFILDLSAVPFIDTTGVETLNTFVSKAGKAGAHVYFAATEPEVQSVLAHHVWRPQPVTFCASIAEARSLAQASLTG